MKSHCTPPPTDKKKYIKDIAVILINDYGKKKYYKPKEIKKAHQKSKWHDYLGFDCWAMSTFSSHSDFDEYHLETGEICDFTEMKSTMLNGLAISTTTDWQDIPNLDIDTSWLDFGDVFEHIFSGIGDFVSGIFDTV